MAELSTWNRLMVPLQESQCDLSEVDILRPVGHVLPTTCFCKQFHGNTTTPMYVVCVTAFLLQWLLTEKVPYRRSWQNPGVCDRCRPQSQAGHNTLVGTKWLCEQPHEVLKTMQNCWRMPDLDFAKEMLKQCVLSTCCVSNAAGCFGDSAVSTITALLLKLTLLAQVSKEDWYEIWG